MNVENFQFLIKGVIHKQAFYDKCAMYILDHPSYYLVNLLKSPDFEKVIKIILLYLSGSYELDDVNIRFIKTLMGSNDHKKYYCLLKFLIHKVLKQFVIFSINDENVFDEKFDKLIRKICNKDKCIIV